MRRFRAQVESVGLLPPKTATARFGCALRDIPRAGQPVFALEPGEASPTRLSLFPYETMDTGFACILPSDHGWRAGDEVDFLGPVGPGFQPPAAARRWLLMSIDAEVYPLMPLIGLARERGASISLWAEAAPFRLPADVEIATDLQASLDWAEFLAVCAAASSLPALGEALRPGRASRVGVAAQILVMHPMPCALGGCMACAVRARRGWRLACLDGPVFSLEDLAW